MSSNIGKKELVACVAKRLSLPPTAVDPIVDATLEEI
jgi:nucleoid DNA-binding protein